MRMGELTDRDFVTTVSKRAVTLVIFGAEHCADCKAVRDAIPEDMFSGWLRVYYADIARARNSANMWMIQSVPTLVLFREGKPLGAKVGSHAPRIIESWVHETIARRGGVK
jgi:thioredoxin 1